MRGEGEYQRRFIVSKTDLMNIFSNAKGEPMVLQRWFMLVSVVLVLFIPSCSSPENEEEKGAIEQKTEVIAAEAVSKITTPIDKAKLAKELHEFHNPEIQESKEIKE